MSKETKVSDVRTVRPKDAIKLIKRCFEVDRPVGIWAGPGIGKSDLIHQIAEEQGRKVIDVRLILCDPTDLKGLPIYDQETKTMRWARPDELPGDALESPDLQNAILFLDEIVSAPTSVQAAAYQLMLNKRIGEYRLPKDVRIVCAGNRTSDRGVVYEMPTPLANRLIHLNLETHFEDWQEWALHNGIKASVVGFLTQHKHRLNNFDPKDKSKAFATPRSWMFASQLLDDDMPRHLKTALMSGTVGEAIALEFIQHLEISEKMPSVDDILAGKKPKLEVSELSALYSLVISMCYSLKEMSANVKGKDDTAGETTKNRAFSNFLEYIMDNMQHEMAVLGIRTAITTFGFQVNIKDDYNNAFQRFSEKFRPFMK